jgi:hypothetical protein
LGLIADNHPEVQDRLFRQTRKWPFVKPVRKPTGYGLLPTNQQARRYTLDGELVDIEEFIKVNTENHVGQILASQVDELRGNDEYAKQEDQNFPKEKR